MSGKLSDLHVLLRILFIFVLFPFILTDSTIAFKMYCGFSNGTMCQMNRCSLSGDSWELVTQAYGGPSSDHTSLPSGNADHGTVSKLKNLNLLNVIK